MTSDWRSLVELMGAAILAGATAAHLFWALGGRTGLGVAIPEAPGRRIFQPSRGACLAVALALVAALAVLAIQMLDPTFITAPAAGWNVAASWVLALVFTARTIGDVRYVGLFKRVRGTRFATYDCRLYTPLCALVAAAFVLAALE